MCHPPERSHFCGIIVLNISDNNAPIVIALFTGALPLTCTFSFNIVITDYRAVERKRLYWLNQQTATKNDRTPNVVTASKMGSCRMVLHNKVLYCMALHAALIL